MDTSFLQVQILWMLLILLFLQLTCHDILSNNNFNHSLIFLPREKEVLQEKVAAFEAEKPAFEVEKADARERDILREQVVALEVEKIVLAAEKVEVVASLNKFLNDSVTAWGEFMKSRKIWRAHYRKKRLPILDMHMEIPSKEGDAKIYTNDKVGFSEVPWMRVPILIMNILIYFKG
ncbi:hypothetical protein ACOSQ3_004560 [Xanthoceras sorbifolium]